jgi:hypothetical protein
MDEATKDAAPETAAPAPPEAAPAPKAKHAHGEDCDMGREHADLYREIRAIEARTEARLASLAPSATVSGAKVEPPKDRRSPWTLAAFVLVIAVLVLVVRRMHREAAPAAAAPVRPLREVAR